MQAHVPAASVLFMAVSLVLSFGVPVALLVRLPKGRKGAAGAFFAGMLGFFVPQALIRIPILQALGKNEAWLAFARSETVWYCLLLALTAGLFETAGRLLVFVLLLKDRYSYTAGFAAGAGHGSFEAVYLVGLTYINNLVLSLMINSGSAGSLSGALSPDALGAAVSALADTPSYMFLLGGVERVFTIAFHIALSVLLLGFIMRGRTAEGFVTAAALHTCVDFGTAMLHTAGADVLITEGAVALAAAGSVWYLVRARKTTFRGQVDIPPDPAEKAAEEGF